MSQHDDDPAPDDTGAIRRVDEVTGALESLMNALEEGDELAVAMHRVCWQAVHAIDEADWASVTLLNEGRHTTAATTSEQVTEIDQAQYDAGEGPCLESARTGKVMRVTVDELGDRWPDFAATATEAHVGSYLSAPLFIDREYHGSLNLYSHDAHGFSALEAALLELYTTAAESALRIAHRYQQARARAEQLQRALSSRAEIDQAKGIIMAAKRIPADEAFSLLVAQSQRRNIKLRDLATQLITDITTADD